MDEAGFSKEDRENFFGKPIQILTSFSDMIPDRKEKHENTIGAFNGVLYFAKLTSTSKIDSIKFFYKDISYRKDFRDTFGGIKIYRDNFRVRPYGEPRTSSYDWLLLSGRKNRSPAAVSHPTGAWRVHSDQMLGSIFISRINTSLPDQANREGIVETKEFGLLKQFIISVIQLFERDRQYVCRKLSAYYDRTHETEIIQEEINRKSEEEKQSAESQQREDIKPQVIEVSKAKVLIDQKDEIIRDLEDENRLLRVLATTGIITNTYVHEFKGLTHTLNMKIVMAKEAIELDRDLDSALSYVLQANTIRESFNSWYRVTIESVKRDKRFLKQIDLLSFTGQLIDAWNNILSNKNISITLSSKHQEILFECFPYEIETIFSNLIANSISSFESNVAPENQAIQISFEDRDDYVILHYSDSGVGLSDSYKRDPNRILEPFETDKRDNFGETIGTGMGMWIINRTVTEYSGSIDLSQNMLQTNGFFISIILMRKEV